MPKPRKEQICLEATPYCHCVSRCVRKAFLCGFDASSQVSYEHRRAWLEDELLKQSAILQRLGIAPEHWLTLTQTFEESFNDLVGSPDSLTENLNLLNRKRRSNINNCKVLLS